MADHTSSPPTSTSAGDTPFDYIVVGSGAGGGPLAARLAELGHAVLVLEAGPDHRAGPPTSPARVVTDVPALHAPCSEFPDTSWRFFVDHYRKPPGDDPKRDEDGIFYPRATGIGGCTIHNAMITIAGPAADWDELAWFLGDRSWASDAMRGYFQRVERCEYHRNRPRPRTYLRRVADTLRWLVGQDDDPTVGRHGFDGWLRTSVVDLRIGLRDKQLIKMLKAAAVTSARAGMDAPWRLAAQLFRGEATEALDPNHFRRQTERPEGLALIPSAIYGNDPGNGKDRGHRSSPARRLLEVADRLPGRLRIATNCLATKVLLEQTNGVTRAVGIEYLHGSRLYGACPKPNGESGTLHRVHARREVILCGGAFNTPQLLMLSGIGPAEHLHEKGVDCLVHSPGVGQNLQDRYEVTVVSRMKEPFSLLQGATFKLPAGPDAVDDPMKEWRGSGQGLYASNGAVLGILKRSKPDLAQPDLFIFGIPLKFEGYKVGYSEVAPKDFDLFTWAILKSHTQNRGGTVKLRSKEPRDVPEINFHYFGSTETGPPRENDPDLDAVYRGVEFVRRIADTAGGVVKEEVHPGRGTAGESDVKKWIMREAWGHHACGTCRMGRPTDPMAVIDRQFRVLGPVDPADPLRSRDVVGSLRVVDASIFPNIPGYFIVSNVYVASEKAADVIHESVKQGRTPRPVPVPSPCPDHP